MSDMDNNLTQLTKDHVKTMLLLNEAEHWLADCTNADQAKRLEAEILDLIAIAEYLTGQIHDLKQALDSHDCHLGPEDGCDCVKEGYARD